MIYQWYWAARNYRGRVLAPIAFLKSQWFFGDFNAALGAAVVDVDVGSAQIQYHQLVRGGCLWAVECHAPVC